MDAHVLGGRLIRGFPGGNVTRRVGLRSVATVLAAAQPVPNGFRLFRQHPQASTLRRPIVDPDGLLALVVRHPDLEYLWRCCKRRDWRNWLVHAATAWRLIPTTRNRARPFAEIDHELLASRREEVWYALDPRAERLNVASLWCLFRDRVPRPGDAVH